MLKPPAAEQRQRLLEVQQRQAVVPVQLVRQALKHLVVGRQQRLPAVPVHPRLAPRAHPRPAAWEQRHEAPVQQVHALRLPAVLRVPVPIAAVAPVVRPLAQAEVTEADTPEAVAEVEVIPAEAVALAAEAVPADEIITNKVTRSEPPYFFFYATINAKQACSRG